MPRPYPPEFRQRALDLVRSGRAVPEVATLLGTAQWGLYRWKQRDLTGRGLKPGTGRAEPAEVVAARKKIRDLEEKTKSSSQGIVIIPVHSGPWVCRRLWS
jgi:transposase-like protein